MFANTTFPVLATVVCSLGATILDSPCRQLPPSIATLVFRFLDCASASALRRASPHFHHQWGHTRLFPPSPSCYRRRRYGFGKASPLLLTAHSSPSPYFLVHLVWDWLSVDRRSLASAMPTIADYATLWVAATHLDLSSLQASRPSSDATPICKDRAYRMAAALLRFNFNYGDFVRWLGSEYTGAQRDWDATFDIVDSIRTSSVPPGYPAIGFDRAVQLATEGVLLAGHYHILFPRFIKAFIPGLFLALITWIAPKGRPGDNGRLCVDPSTILDNESDAAGTPDDGAANAQLPRTGADDKEDYNPSVY